MKAFLLSALPALASARSVLERNDCTTSILNSTYPQITFGQSRSNIDFYTSQSIRSLVLAVNHSNGQFLDGIPNLPGHLFYWQSQNGWTGVSRNQFQTQNSDLLIDVLSAQNALAREPGDSFGWWGVPLINNYNDDCAWAALSNLQAYEAYGREIFLKRAIAVWQFLSTHGYIDQGVVDTGYLEGTKYTNVTLQAKCNGKSMIGGVYWVNGGPPAGGFDAAASPDVNAVSTGNYALLSAELCRLTGDMSYCARAYTNVQWMDRHMVTPDGLIWDHLNGTSCTLSNYTFTYNSGLYIAAYAELGHLTKNATATSLAQRVAIASMNTPIWNTASGINKEGAGDEAASDDSIGFKSIMIRYLHKAYPWFTDEAVKAAVVQYINIQYWALTQLGSDSSTHPIRYGRNWTGPAFNLSSEHAQLAALDVLNGLALSPDSAFPTGSASSSPVAMATNGTRCL